jgi:hypothetical protein
VVARRVRSLKLRDYLTIAAIGDTIVGISLSTSALEQTYGVAAHSLALLSSYLFSMGLYVVAISISQDSSLRKSIKRSMVDLIDNIGSAQMKVIRNQQKEMEEQTGGFSYTVSENDVKEYMALIIDERRRSNILARDGSNKKTTQQNVPNTIASKISDSISKRIEKGETNIIIKGLIEKLQTAGTKIEKTVSTRTTETRVSPPSSLFINPDTEAKYELILVNGEPLRAFEFKDDFSDEVGEGIITSLLSVSDSSDHSNAVFPESTRYHHFYSSPKLIVEYIGNNPSTLKVLAKVLGKEDQTREVKSSIREEPESEK